MGQLSNQSTGRQIELEAETTIGRSPTNSLVLKAGIVSGQHASLRWLNDCWHIRDLGSSNGTWVDGHQLEGTRLVPLSLNARVCFGSTAEEWRLTQTAVPSPLLKTNSERDAIPVGAVPISLPSEEITLATLFWETGSLLLERESSRRVLHNGDTFEVGDELFTLVFPRTVAATTHARTHVESLADAELCIRPSPNEEHIDVSLSVAGRSFQLKSRVHHYLLLLLARQRLSDREHGSSVEEEGWLGLEEVCTMLRSDRQRVNTDVYRLRKQFSQIDLVDAANIIERRLDSHEVRIGTARLRVV